MSTTHEIFIEPSALLVDLPDEHVVLCHEVIGQSGLRVHRSASVEAACEKIPRALPHLVIAGGGLSAASIAMLEDRAIAVGAVFVVLASGRDYESLLADLRGGVATARERFSRRRTGALRHS